MSRGFPSMTALLGLLAVAGYQNRDKIAEMLGSASRSAGGSAQGGLGGLLGSIGGSAGAGGLSERRLERDHRAIPAGRSGRNSELLGSNGPQ